jgi:hypothetical protein
MEPAWFREQVRERRRVELDRLGSAHLLAALTGGDPDPESLLAVTASSERAARETFERWAVDESNPGVRAAFQAAAAQEADHHERVRRLLDDPVEDAGGGVLHGYLRAREDTLPRVAAGMVGRPLYSVRAYERMRSFLRAESASRPAAVLGDLQADTEGTLDRGCDLLATLCEDEGDGERAVGAAAYAVQVAADDVVDALASQDRSVPWVP